MIVILTQGAGSHQVDHEDNPALSGEQSSMDHLYWNTIHLERDAHQNMLHIIKPEFNIWEFKIRWSKLYKFLCSTSVLNDSGCPYGARKTSLPAVRWKT